MSKYKQDHIVEVNKKVSSVDKNSINPYKKMKCRYVYDYCDPEYCICIKSSKWDRENNNVNTTKTFGGNNE
jgi:hypothetical protein